MYSNLKYAMLRENISIEDIAKSQQLHRNTVSNKINGGSFYIQEASSIWKEHFKTYDFGWLFEKAKITA